MKILIILILLSSPVYAFDKWDKEDIALQTILTSEILIDWYLTKKFVKQGIPESNPFLGKYPSQKKIDTLIGSAIFIHAGLSHILPKKYRNYWQLIFIGIEAQAINNCYQAGIKLEF